MGFRQWLGMLFGRPSEPVPLPMLEGSADTIEEVLARMAAIEAALPPDDGVAAFNRMYRTVTADVLEASRALEFEDRIFLERLDVVFAQLYFDALEAFQRDPESAPRCWVPLFDARTNRRLAPIQFALAGMNAHINHDLVLAVARTCEELSLQPQHDSAQYRDFLMVNRLLAEAQEKVELWFKRGVLGIVDRILGRTDEVVQMWSIGRAREAAWVQAETLWTLRGRDAVTSRWLATLDRMVGFAGRGLLLPPPL